MIPEDLKYTKEHEWVRVDETEAVFGITDHAQSEMGDITFVELPEKDATLKRSGTYATVESVKAASDIYAPVSGIVIEVNDVLQDNPETINNSPYEEGWICRISMSDLAELDKLMDAAAYEAYLKEL